MNIPMHFQHKHPLLSAGDVPARPVPSCSTIDAQEVVPFGSSATGFKSVGSDVDVACPGSIWLHRAPWL